MKTKRIAQIDIMKLLCAFFVVTIHIVTDYRVQEGGISKNVLLLESFLRCCVPVFFMCSGYFLFIKDNCIKQTYKKMIETLVLPTILIVFVWYIFNDAVENQNTIIGCMRAINAGTFVPLLKSIINWDLSIVKNGFYLWFMISLIKIYIAYPILKLVCSEESKVTKIRRYCLGIGIFAEMLLPSIENLSHNTVYIYGYSIFGDYSFIYILLGYELYLLFKKKENRFHWSVYGFLVYMTGSLMTYWASVYIDIGYDGNFKGWFFEYNQIGVLISAIGFFYFIRNLNVRNEKLCGILSFLGKRTFSVYLVHYFVVRGLTCYGMMEVWKQMMPRAIFYFFASMVCYICSMMISILLYCILYVFRWAIGRLESVRTG